jgi:hypothetical protein
MGIWLAANWFTLIQTVGVVGGLFYSATVWRLDAKVRRTEVILALTEAHRKIWEKMIEQPELARILDADIDLRTVPPSAAERRFVLLVILHLDTVRLAVKEGAYDASTGMRDDMRAFLALPVPREVANSVLPYQAPQFQEYLHEFMN